MRVMPRLKWPLLLRVREVFVINEFGDQRCPPLMYGNIRNDPKFEHYLGPRSRHTLDPSRNCALGKSRWNQIELDDLCPLRRRHDAREIMRISEERKDYGQANGDPVLRVQALTHGEGNIYPAS